MLKIKVHKKTKPETSLDTYCISVNEVKDPKSWYRKYSTGEKTARLSLDQAIESLIAYSFSDVAKQLSNFAFWANAGEYYADPKLGFGYDVRVVCEGYEANKTV